MSKQIYELVWDVRCGEFEFISREWKVFSSMDEASAYAKQKVVELNDGLSPDEKAWDGYCYTLGSIRPLSQVDGYRVILKEQKSARP